MLESRTLQAVIFWSIPLNLEYILLFYVNINWAKYKTDQALTLDAMVSPAPTFAVGKQSEAIIFTVD